MAEAPVVDSKEAFRLLSQIGRGATRAANGAINDAMKSVRAKLSQEVRSDVNLQAAYVKGLIKVSQRPKTNKPTGILTVSDSPTLLRRYGAKTLKLGGVFVKVSRKKKTKKLNSGFITTSNKFLFLRGVKGDRYPNIKLLYAPSVAQIVQQELDTTKLSDQFTEILKKAAQRKLESVLRRRENAR